MELELDVRITQDHIQDGVPCASAKCPVALAIVDALKSVGHTPTREPGLSVGVDLVSVWIGPGVFLTAELPAAAQRFIAAYDAPRGLWPEPLGFTIRLIEAEVAA